LGEAKAEDAKIINSKDRSRYVFIVKKID